MAKKTGTAVAAAKSNIPANWKQRLMAKAKAQHEAIDVSAGTKMSINKKGEFEFQGSNLGNAIEVVVLAFCNAKQWYNGPYQKDNPSPPACFALKQSTENIAPHADSPEPQSEVCKGCPKNEWGSGKSASGKDAKACKDKVRIAVIHVDDIKNLDDISQAQIALMELPVMSAAPFKKYAKKLTGATDLPLWCFVTKLKADEESDYEKLESASMVEEVPPGLLDGLEKLSEQGDEMVLAPYDVSRYTPSKGAKAARASKKTPTKRSRLS